MVFGWVSGGLVGVCLGFWVGLCGFWTNDLILGEVVQFYLVCGATKSLQLFKIQLQLWPKKSS